MLGNGTPKKVKPELLGEGGITDEFFRGGVTFGGGAVVVVGLTGSEVPGGAGVTWFVTKDSGAVIGDSSPSVSASLAFINLSSSLKSLYMR